ncbi:DNA polymerase III subunit gamma and tau [Microbacterium sp. MC2]
MTTALYRRYRPESFGEMIGQSQVTEPLMTALRSDRVGHAYLFSGPRGCGKTTSARILARCLNCAAGPTDTPCGTCDSCVELSRAGGGSLDVVEIDAASHNGVDDARDLRERAVFAPARDRFKIFILDEAHMVTAQGFNALLKLVEEPPAHVKFIFATTEPDKVIGTIRSRTHHYPFRLVAPGPMLEYVEQLCAAEGVQVEPGVLPLVVRAGGGSPRDTLSLLDQLIAGSEPSTDDTQAVVRYERAVALLGYTHAELLDEVVDAFGARDAAAAFAAVDRVVQTGQDPRRFVDDLLERLRDLIIVAATGDGAAAVLRGMPADELERMGVQAAVFGTDRLSRIADLVVATLDEMSGATSPRLQLELMVARVLAATDAGVPAAGGAAAAGAGGVAGASSAAGAAAGAASAGGIGGGGAGAAPAGGAGAGVPAGGAGGAGAGMPVGVPAAATDGSAPATPGDHGAPASAPPAHPLPAGPLTLMQVRDAWTEILNRLEPVSRSSWMIASAARPVAYTSDDVLTLSFQSQADVAAFKKLNAGKGPSEDLRGAIQSVLGVRVKYIARHDADPAPAPPGSLPAASAGDQPAPPNPEEPSSGPAHAPLHPPADQTGTPGRPAPVSSGPAGDAPAQAGAASGPAPPAPGPGGAAPTDAAPAAGYPSASANAHTAAPPSTLAGSHSAPSAPSPQRASPPAAAAPAAAPAPSAPARPHTAQPASPARPGPHASAPAAAPVTEWAVATIPGSDTAPAGPGLAVDDEPEDAARAAWDPTPSPRDGAVVTEPEPGPYDDDAPPPEDFDAPVPPRAPVVVERPAAQPPASRPTRNGGIERVGEAVVRQMLGATFLREEPYTPPTRFN